MKSIRHLVAALMLLAWILAGAHLALAHGGELFGTHFAAAPHEDHGDDERPGQHRHHDLGAVISARSAKSVEQLSAPQWTPLPDELGAQLAAILRELDTVPERSRREILPADERASGSLLDSHTALPVRGPSLA